jgi:hypothetical protein
MTGSPLARQGIWTEVRPGSAGIADYFAEVAARETGGAPQVKPLLHRTDRAAQLTLKGTESADQVAAKVAQAWDKGFDSVLLKNYLGPSGKPGESLVVRNPNQLRSVSAVFDPAKRDSPELLASLAAFGILTPTAFGSSAPPE